ncbi:MAG: MMPL family transporter [Candidatus Marinimicrobia bacterium]|nr:MMPL family transporter [Candidatus Neomarinimicrobiota bacterium]
MKTVFQKWINFILDHPKWIIGCTAFITIAMIYSASQLKMDFSIEELFAINDSDVEKYFDFLEEFEREDNLILLMYECDDPFSYENLNLNKTLIEKFESIKGIDEVTGLSNLEIFTEGEDELLRSVYPYIPLSTDSLLEAKKRISSSELAQETLISKDGKLASIAIELDASFNNHDKREKIIEEIDHYQNLANWKWHQSGIPVLRTRYVQLMVTDTIRFLIPVAIMIIILFTVVFRSWLALLIPMSIIIMVVIWTIGLMVILDIDFNIMTYIIPTLLFIIGIGDSVHFLVKYFGTLSDVKDKKKALSQTIEKIGTAIFLTSITTSIGFGSLIRSNIDIVRQFGVMTAAGVMFAFILTVTYLPAMIMLFKQTPITKLKSYSLGIRINILKGFIKIVRSYPKPIIIFTFFFAVISIIGASKINSHNSLMDDLKPGTTLYDDIMIAEERMGAILPLEIIVSLKNDSPNEINDIRDPVFLEHLDKLQKYISSINDIGKMISMVDHIKEFNRAMNDGNNIFYTIPNSRSAITQTVLIYSDKFNSLTNFDYSKARITGRVKDIDSKRASEIKTDIYNYVENNIPDYMKVEITGTTFLALATNDYLVSDLTTSFVAAFILITVVMIILFKSVPITLISIIPNTIPMLAMAAIMGYFDIILRPPTAMTFAVAFGIAVDDTIHYLTRYRMELPALKWHHRLANDRTIMTTGLAMITTTGILVTGFLILVFSSFTPTADFGLLAALTIFIALVCDLTFLPALLSLVKPNINKNE